MKYGKDLFFPKGWRGRAGEPGFPAIQMGFLFISPYVLQEMLATLNKEWHL